MRLHSFRAVAAGMLMTAASLAAGCGSSPSPKLSAAAADRFHGALAATRAAADAHDKEKTLGALAALSGLVSRESHMRHLSARDEQALRTGIARARRRVALDVKAPPPKPMVLPPAAAQRPTPVPQAKPAKKRRKSHGKGKDNG